MNNQKKVMKLGSLVIDIMGLGDSLGVYVCRNLSVRKVERVGLPCWKLVFFDF